MASAGVSAKTKQFVHLIVVCSAGRGDAMPISRRDLYFFKAAELTQLAKTAKYSALKAQFEGLALAYLHLADQVQQNRDAEELPLNRVLGSGLGK